MNITEIFDSPLPLTPEKDIKLAIEKTEPSLNNVAAFSLIINDVKYYIVQYIKDGAFEVHYGIVGESDDIKNIHKTPPTKLLATIIDRYKRKISTMPIRIVWPKNKDEIKFREFYKKIMLKFIQEYNISKDRIIENEDSITISLSHRGSLPESLYVTITKLFKNGRV